MQSAQIDPFSRPIETTPITLQDFILNPEWVVMPIILFMITLAILGRFRPREITLSLSFAATYWPLFHALKALATWLASHDHFHEMPPDFIPYIHIIASMPAIAATLSTRFAETPRTAMPIVLGLSSAITLPLIAVTYAMMAMS